MIADQKAEKDNQQTFWPLIADDAIDRAMNTLIPQARTLIEELFKNTRQQMERHQFTNLVAVASETNSAEVVMDYVRYQIGRDSGGNTWRIRRPEQPDRPEFGIQLIEQLEGFRSMAKGLMLEAIRQYEIEPQDRAKEEKRLWMMLVRRFVNSLHHNFVYYDAEKKESHL